MSVITLNQTRKQEAAWDKLIDYKTRFIVFGGGAGGGKSWLGCEWLLANCYLYAGSKWFLGREELKRLMSSSFLTWSKVCQFHKIPKDDWDLNGQYNYIQFKNGSRIDLLDLKYLPSDPLYERFGSLEYTGGWVEEAGEVDFLAVDVLKSRVGRHMNVELGLLPKTLYTCNPSKNWIYQYIYRPWKNNELPEGYAFIQALYGDNPHTAEAYGKTLGQIHDTVMKERLMFGNWEYDDDPTALITYDAIIDLFSNVVDKGNSYLVADIARYGSDKTTVSIWNGLRCTTIKTFHKKGIDEVIAIINEELKANNIPRSRCLVDEDGVGGGVVDGLRGIKGFVANRKPISGNYINMKAQCAYLLADKVNEHKIGVDMDDEFVRQQIIQELEQIKSRDADKDSPRKILEKDKVKEMIGRSPDYGDLFIMRMYFELSPQKNPDIDHRDIAEQGQLSYDEWTA